MSPCQTLWWEFEKHQLTKQDEPGGRRKSKRAMEFDERVWLPFCLTCSLNELREQERDYLIPAYAHTQTQIRALKRFSLLHGFFFSFFYFFIFFSYLVRLRSKWNLLAQFLRFISSFAKYEKKIVRRKKEARGDINRGEKSESWRKRKWGSGGSPITWLSLPLKVVFSLVIRELTSLISRIRLDFHKWGK